MAYQTLYRKWRPLTFDDVIGQTHITKTLKNEILSESVKHAYLFCGTIGTGKTSIAKILSRAVNCLNPNHANPCNECENCKGILNGSILDVIEFDAASNSKVENMRDILDEVIYSSSKTRYKVYIIDEVHMLSNSAFNALLKTLEEPPSHVIFILATTEIQKLPKTIISRCQRFDFMRISKADLTVRMKEILYAEGVTCDDRTLDFVCKAADGSARDGLSILDKVISTCGKTLEYENVIELMGLASDDYACSLIAAIAKNDIGEILDVTNKINSAGISLENFASDMMNYFRDLAVTKTCKDSSDILLGSAQNIQFLKEYALLFTVEKLIYAIDIISKTLADAKYSKNSKILYEIAFIKIAKPMFDGSPEAILARISELEVALSSGTLPSPPQVSSPRAIPLQAPPLRETEPFADEQPIQQQGQSIANKSRRITPTANPVVNQPTAETMPKKSAKIASTLNWDTFKIKLKAKDLTLMAPMLNTQGVLHKNTLYIIFEDGDAFLKTLVSMQKNKEIIQELAQSLYGDVIIRTELRSDFEGLEIKPPKSVSQMGESTEISPNKGELSNTQIQAVTPSESSQLAVAAAATEFDVPPFDMDDMAFEEAFSMSPLPTEADIPPFDIDVPAVYESMDQNMLTNKYSKYSPIEKLMKLQERFPNSIDIKD